jgi:hypothetical protein
VFETVVSDTAGKSSLAMRPTYLLFVATAATALLVSCNKPDASTPTPASSTSRPSPADPKVVSGWTPDSVRPALSTSTPSGRTAPPTEVVALESDSLGNPLELLTSRIDTTVTLGAWLRSHPSDRISEIAPVEGIHDPFCRAAVVKMQLAGRTLARSALFYMPVPPKGEKLPTDTARVAQELCVLRTLALSTEEMDWPTGHAARDALVPLIDKRLGAHRDGLELGAGGISGTTEGRTWKGPGTTVVIATAPSQKPPAIDENEPERPDTSRKLSRVFAVAYAPGSGAQDFDIWRSRREQGAAQRAEDRKSLYRNVDSAIVWAALPGVAADLRTVVTYLRNRDEDKPNQLRSPQVDTALLRALKAIHDAAPSLPPPRRAAALLAADVALFATWPMLPADSNNALRSALTSLGITFDDLPIDQLVQNTRPWLWEAYRLDSLGRAGRVAFVELLAQGWTTRGACKESDEGGQDYERIIKHGEAALSKGDNNPLIHFYVASAYKTIYDLANYGDNEYFDSNAAKPQAESARLKGIEHYRAALESLPDPVLRREAWTRAMRLILRRSGEQPEYVCFYD